MKPIRIVSLFLLCSTAFVFASTDCCQIDAKTSASGKFKIISGQAYATSAQITWWDYYSDGEQQAFKYGTTTMYGTTIDLLPFTNQTNITTTIPNLSPNTKYYLQIYRVYEGTSHLTNHTFTTFNGTGIKQPVPGASLALDLRDKVVEAYLPNGVRAASMLIPKGGFAVRLDARLTRTFDLQSGVYLFVVKEQGAIISRIKMAVVR
jgi:hypothetical protein